MADNKPNTPPGPVVRDNSTVKDPSAGPTPFDAARTNDPASPDRNLPQGPQPAPDRPTLPRPAANATFGSTRNVPRQPIVPAPSEQMYPSAVAEPDPARSPEERQAAADAHIEAHNMRPGIDRPNVPLMREQTSDGEPDKAQPPKPVEK